MARGRPGRGWTADVAPMSDGGEGLLDAVGGEPRLTEVAGPLGQPTRPSGGLLRRRTAAPGRD